MTSKFLKNPTIPFRVKKGKNAARILEDMLATGFQGRSLGEAFAIWKEMLKQPEITIWLGISGAIIPAGMRRIISYLVEKRFIDVIVSTGAQVFHDIAEALGVTHFRGSPLVDDNALLEEGIDRFYNVFVQEKLQRQVDRKIQRFIEDLAPGRQYSSREFLELLGFYLEKEAVHKDSFVIQAAKSGVPLLVPALSDSSIGYSFVMARRGIQDGKDGKSFARTGTQTFRYIDQMKDTDESVQIAERSKKSGVVYLGGGVPKNFIQQTELLNLILGNNLRGHEFAIQITTDTPHFGGLSGCTFTEAQSWGKIAKSARTAQCFSDVTIALPLLAQALCEVEALARRRVKPKFIWSKKGLTIRRHGK